MQINTEKSTQKLLGEINSTYRVNVLYILTLLSILYPGKKIGIVGYWATSISTVSTTVLSNKVKNGLISRFGHYFSAFGCIGFAFE